jgi:hypothetical protein
MKAIKKLVVIGIVTSTLPMCSEKAFAGRVNVCLSDAQTALSIVQRYDSKAQLKPNALKAFVKGIYAPSLSSKEIEGILKSHNFVERYNSGCK